MNQIRTFILASLLISAVVWGGGLVKQIPIKGNAFHVALADIDGDSEPELICACFHGEVYCLDRRSGEVRWSYKTGGFPFDLAARDIDGDGKAEVFVASADTNVYALRPDGSLLWKFKTSWPAYQVSPGNIDGKMPLEIAIGGAGRTARILSAQGKEVGSKSFRDATRHVRVGDVDGDGVDEVFVCMAYGTLYAHKGVYFNLIWRKQLTRHAKKGRADMKHWRPYSLELIDINGDGCSEMLWGSGFYDGNDIRVLRGDGEELWAKVDGFVGTREGFHYAYTNITAGDILPNDGLEIVALTGPRLHIFDKDGNLLGVSQAPMGFTDVAVSDGEIFLGSAPNGDNTLYHFKPRTGWKSEFASIQYIGLMAEIEKTLADIREKILDYEGVPIRKPETPYIYNASGGNPNTEKLLQSHFGLHRAFHKVFPYDNVDTAMAWSVHCVEPVPGFGRSRPGNLRVSSRLLTPERVVALAKFLEDNEQYFLMDVGHGCRPQVPLDICEKVLQTAPKYLIGFCSSENSAYDERLEKYLKQYWVPLMDLCLKYGKKKAVLIEKGAWWATVPAMKKYYDLMFNGKYREVLHASVEDSNSRSPDLNLAGRVGLWLTGAIDHFSVRLINDEVCWNRYWEWEFPITGHPFLRQAIAHTAMGGDYYELNLDIKDWSRQRAYNPWAFSRLGRESMEMIIHMLGKGILIPPTRDEIAFVSPIALRVREPSAKVLKDAFAFHDFRTNKPDAELDDAPFGHLGAYWGMSPTPPGNISSYSYNQTFQYGNFVPSTPYGFVAIVPELRSLRGAPWFNGGVVTDGLHFYNRAKESGLAARARVIAKLREAAKSLPFRVEGDVFLQAQRFTPRHYRIYAVDPGFIDPAERDVKLHIQVGRGVSSIHDLINDVDLAAEGKVLRFKVPAGAFRIIDIRLD